MSHDPVQDDAPVREEVVAYLDGELDPAASRRMEERAAIEPQTRRILEDFDRTWHLLDELESPPASEDFTRTTLEMVALAAADDASKAKAPRRRWQTRLLVGAGLAAAAAAGFFLVTALVPDPNAQLLQELPLLENVDEYRDIGSIDFLRALEKENLFTKDADGAAATAGPGGVETFAAETLGQRRQRVEAMTADQREDLFHNEQQFRALPAEEQQHIRDLRAAIEGASDRGKLVAVMNRYSKWLEDQPVWERGQLHRMKQPQRIAEIKTQLARHKRSDNEIRLDSKSRQAITRWVEHFMTEHGARLLPRDNQGKPGELPPELAKLSPEERHRVLRGMGYRGWGAGNPAVRFQLSDAERASLRASLTTEIRAQLDARPQPEQVQIIAGWLRETAAAQFDERLAEFFENTLSNEQRDALMSLPADETHKRLADAYESHLRQQMKFGEPPHHGDQHGDHHKNHAGGAGGPGGGRRWTDRPEPPEGDSKPEKTPSSSPPRRTSRP